MHVLNSGGVGRFACGLALAILGALAVPAAQAQGVGENDLEKRLERHYAGKRLTLIVSHKSGGSTGVWAQLIGNHLSRFIPGNPQVVMQQRPGAAGLVATQYMMNQARPDGYSIGAIGGSIVLEAATAGLTFNGERLDIRKLRYVGGVGDSSVAYGRAAAFPKGMDSLLKPARSQLFLGLTGVDHSSAVTVSVMKVLGMDVEKGLKVLSGYSDGAEKQLAMAQGEIDIDEVRTAGYNTMVEPLVRKGEYVALWQLGLMDSTGRLVRSRSAPDIPTFVEVYEKLHGGPPPDSDALVYAMWTARSNVLLRPLVMPPGTPAWIVDGIRAAFARMIEDPVFLSDQKRLLGQDGQIHVNGADAEKLAGDIVGSADKVLAIYNDMTGEPPFK